MSGPGAHHPDREILADFGLGRLDESASLWIEDHLSGCPECCETLLQLKDDTFAGIVRSLPNQDAVANALPLAPSTGIGAPMDVHGDAVRSGSVDGATYLAPLGEPSVQGSLPAELIDHPRYRIVARIGRGGMGDVYRAEHRLMNRPVALKLINSQLVNHPQAVERFRREVQAAAQLSHPNIVTAYDAEQAGNVHLLVMEFVEGTDLATLVQQRGPLPVQQACEYIRQAALGLQHAFEKGMVHRDIKPHNLMLSPDGTVRILDFGLAGFATEAAAIDVADGNAPTMDSVPRHLTTIGCVMGTPDYISPEQARDAHTADIRSDIYSLGCTLHYLLTGKPPFEADSVLDKLKAHLDCAPPSLDELDDDVPPELAAIVRRMLAKEPEERFQTPADVAAALAPFAAEARPVVKRPNDRPWLRLAKWMLVPLLVFAAVIVYLATDTGLIEIDAKGVDVPGAKIVLLKDGKEYASFDVKATQEVQRVRAGKYEVQLRRASDDVQLNVWFKRGNSNNWGEPVQQEVEPVMLYRGGDMLIRVLRKEPPEFVKSDGVSKDGAPPPAIAPFGKQQAKEHQEAWARYLGVPVEYTNSIGMKFRLIPPGEFWMGSTPEEIAEGQKNTGGNLDWNEKIQTEGPKHKVILTQAFYLGVHEVTQQQFETVMGFNPAHFSNEGEGKDVVARLDTSNHPVELVSWHHAAEFCSTLSEKEHLKPFYARGKDSGKRDDEPYHDRGGQSPAIDECAGYRLPTEAEWDAGGRAGTTTKYWIGDNDDELQLTDWCGENSANRTYPVGQLKANPYGLFDIHGNVWEWVHDGWQPVYYANFRDEPAVNPSGPPFGTASAHSHVLRGGDYWRPSRAASRRGLPEYLRFEHVGFRVALPVDAVRRAIEQPATQPDAKQQDVIRAAEEFLAALDEDDPELGHSRLSAFARRIVGRAQFVAGHKANVARYGSLKDRKLVTAFAVVPAPSLPPGRYFAVQFRSTFENAADQTETVMLNLDEDGNWRANAHAISPAPPPLTPLIEPGATKDSSTEVPAAPARRTGLLTNPPVVPPGGLPVGKNLIVDPSLEYTPTGKLPDGWYAWLNDGPDFKCEVVEGGVTGKRCLQISGTGTRGVVFATSIPLDRTKRYALKGRVKVEGEAGTWAVIKLNYFNKTGWLGVDDRIGVTSSDPDWKLLEKTDQADKYSAATLLVPTCHIEGNGTAWFDDLEVVAYDRESLPEDFDARHGKNNRMK